MDRELNKFRTKARIVAFLDLILSSMVLCFWLFVFIGLLTMSSKYNSTSEGRVSGSSDDRLRMDDSNGLTKGIHFQDNFVGPIAPSRTFLNLMWGLLGLFAFGTAVQIIAAVKLLNATQLGKEPLGALRLVRFWRIVCIIFTSLWIFNFFSSFRQRRENVDNFFETTFILTNILIRMSALYVVQQYYNELVSSITAGSLPMHHQPAIPVYPSGVNMGYMYGPQYPPMPSHSMAPPPKYEDVFKDTLAKDKTQQQSEIPPPPPNTNTTAAST